jgi:hypothetical protein
MAGGYPVGHAQDLSICSIHVSRFAVDDKEQLLQPQIQRVHMVMRIQVQNLCCGDGKQQDGRHLRFGKSRT